VYFTAQAGANWAKKSSVAVFSLGAIQQGQQNQFARKMAWKRRGRGLSIVAAGRSSLGGARVSFHSRAQIFKIGQANGPTSGPPQ